MPVSRIGQHVTTCQLMGRRHVLLEDVAVVWREYPKLLARWLHQRLLLQWHLGCAGLALLQLG